MKNQSGIIACSVFKEELEALRSQGFEIPKPQYLDSMLHMRPEKLRQVLDRSLAALDPSCSVCLVYGDCHPYIDDTFKDRLGARTPGINCCEILLGREEYRKLRAEGWFFLLPEWTRRWKTVIYDELGLEEGNARSLFRDMHSGIMYLDTGCSPIPREDLETIGTLLGLPFAIRPTGLENLERALLEAGAGGPP